MRPSIKLFILLILASAFLAACQSLAGTNWTLVSLNGHELIEETNITLSFNKSWMAGYAGCNQYSIKMEIKDDSFIFDEDGAFVTETLCVSIEGIMSQEKEYITTLISVVTYSRSDNRLEMKNENGDVVLIFTKGLPKKF